MNRNENERAPLKQALPGGTPQELADHIPASIVVYKKENGAARVIYTNAYYRSLPRASEERLLGRDEEDLLALVHPDDRAAAYAFFAGLFDTGRPGEISYRSLVNDGSDYRWYHISGMPAPQPDGSVLAYTVFTDITDEKEAERKAQALYAVKAEQYRQETAFYETEAGRALVAKGHYNLSRNTMLTYTPAAAGAFDVDLTKSYDYAYGLYIRFPEREEDRRALAELLDRESLIARCRQGHTRFPFEYRRRKAAGTTAWARLDIRTCANPETDEVECFLYTYDATEANLAQLVMRRMAELNFDLLSVIETGGRTFRDYGVGDRDGETANGTLSYDAAVPAQLAARVPAEQRETVLAACALDTILAELGKNGRYAFSCDFREPDGADARKLFQYCWLDETRQQVFCCRSDVTAQYRGEQERLRQAERAQTLEATVQNLPLGVGVCLLQNGVCSAVAGNRRLRRLLGIGDHADFGDPQHELYRRVHPDDAPLFRKFVDACGRPGAAADAECRYRQTGEETWRWYRTLARTVGQPDGGVLIYAAVEDVTAEKEAERACREARMLYEAAVEEAKLAVWEYDVARRRITRAENESTCSDYRRLGLPRITENAPEALAPYIEDDSLPAFLAMYEAVEKGAPRASCEVWYKREPGAEPRCERLSYITVFDEAGRPVKAYGIGQNITAQKLELQRYREFYDGFDNAYPNSLGSFRLNLTRNLCLDGKSPFPFVMKQKESGTVDGYFREFSKLIADEGTLAWFRGEFTREKLIDRFRRGENTVSFEYSSRLADGLHWRQALLIMRQNPQTEEVEAVTYALNIDEQKRTALIVDHLMQRGFSYIGVIYARTRTFEFFSKNPQIRFPGLRQVTDYEECRAYVRRNFVDPLELRQFDAATDLDGIVAALDRRGRHTAAYNRTENGAVSRCELQYSWLDRDNGEILAVRADTTEAYQQEQERIRQLQTALLEAESACSAKTDFVSRISHDIRTPIGAIANMTAFALEDMGDPEKLRDDLRKIQASNGFLLSLINDVLDISKIDSGKMELKPEPYRLADYMAGARDMFAPLCQQKQIAFTVIGAPEAGCIRVDRTRLDQLTLNLLSNAVKYTPAGGAVTLEVADRPGPDGRAECEICVRDTGIGMSEAFQKTMFEPFTQEYENPLRDRTATGTGLGLSIVKRIAELMRGTIAVTSAPGRGTEVRVTFPADRVTPEAAAAAAPGGADRDRRTPLAGTVLVAEDNQINAEIARRVLASFGLTAVHAENGRAAVDSFAAAPPGTYRAILMDIQMPILNGYDAAARIRALDRPDAKTIPIIAMTADAFSAAIEHSRAVGMTDYVTKPLDVELLRDVLLRRMDPQPDAGTASVREQRSAEETGGETTASLRPESGPSDRAAGKRDENGKR